MHKISSLAGYKMVHPECLPNGTCKEEDRDCRYLVH